MSADAPRRISRLTARALAAALGREGVPEGLLEKAANTCPVHQSLAPSVEKVIEFIWQ